MATIQSLRNKGKKESASKERGEPNKKPSDSHVGNTMPKELHGGPLHGMRHGDVCSGNAVHTRATKYKRDGVPPLLSTPGPSIQNI